MRQPPIIFNKKSVRRTLNMAQQTLPPQLTRPRHPRVTRKVLLSAAVFPPWHGSQVPVARDPDVIAT